MIDFDFIEWDSADDARGNTRHIAGSGISQEEVQDVLRDPKSVPEPSRSTGRPTVVGFTSTGKTIRVVYERHREAGYVTVRPVTAYEVGD